MGFEVISEGDWPDYEVWTCDVCGYSIAMTGTGGDVACCPQCVSRENQDEEEDC